MLDYAPVDIVFELDSHEILGVGLFHIAEVGHAMEER